MLYPVAVHTNVGLAIHTMPSVKHETLTEATI